MKSISKKSLFIILTVALLTIVCTFVAMHYVGANPVRAEGQTPESEKVEVTDMTEQNTSIADADKFALVDGAEIRLVTEGIRFMTNIEETYYKGLVANNDKVEFIAKASNVTYELSVWYKFPEGAHPKFTDEANPNEIFTLSTYFNFDGDISDEVKELVYAMDFATETYIKVTNGATVNYIKAYDPIKAIKSDSSVTRSLRAVANAAELNYTDFKTDGFEIEDLLANEYVKVGKRVKEVMGYTVESGKIFFALPAEYGTPADGATVKAYFNAKPVTAKYNAETKRFDVVSGITLSDLTVGDVNYMTVFNANNEAFTTQAEQVNEINSIGGFEKLQTATNGYYILTSDIAFENVDLNGSEEGNGSWSTVTTFTGVLDGNGYTVENFSGVLFKELQGSILNITFDDAATSVEGMLATRTTGNVKIENSVFDIVTMSGHRGSLLGYQTAGSATLNNVYVSMPTNVNNSKGYLTCHAVTNLNLNNVYFVGGKGLIHSTEGNATTSSGDPNEAYLLKNATINGVAAVDGNGETNLANLKDKQYFLTSNEQIVYEMKVSEVINNAFDNGVLTENATHIKNATDFSALQTATTGYYVLDNDVNFSEFEGSWSPTSKFAGTLNGNKHAVQGFKGGSYNLFKGFAGKIVNIDFYDIEAVCNRGFLAWSDTSSDVTIENSTFSFDSVGDSTWFSLLGYQSGGKATLRNVAIEMPDYSTYSNKDYRGFITCYWVTGIEMENVYLFGGTGTVHSVQEHSTHPSSDATITGTYQVKTFGAETGKLIYDEKANIPQNIKNASEKGYFNGVILLNEKNITELKGATTCYYILTKDVDLSGIDWTTDTWFEGLLDGRGNTISNFSVVLNKGLFGTMAGGTIKNLNLHVTNLPDNTGAISRIVNGGATIENVNLVIETKGSTNCGALFQVVQGGNVDIDNVQVYVKAGGGKIVAGQGMTSTAGEAIINISKLYCYGATTELLGSSEIGTLNGTVNEDYFIYNSDVANAIANNGTDFIKTEYERLNSAN